MWLRGGFDERPEPLDAVVEVVGLPGLGRVAERRLELGCDLDEREALRM